MSERLSLKVKLPIVVAATMTVAYDVDVGRGGGTPEGLQSQVDISRVVLDEKDLEAVTTHAAPLVGMRVGLPQ